MNETLHIPHETSTFGMDITVVIPFIVDFASMSPFPLTGKRVLPIPVTNHDSGSTGKKFLSTDFKGNGKQH